MVTLSVIMFGTRRCTRTDEEAATLDTVGAYLVSLGVTTDDMTVAQLRSILNTLCSKSTLSVYEEKIVNILLGDVVVERVKNGTQGKVVSHTVSDNRIVWTFDERRKYYD